MYRHTYTCTHKMYTYSFHSHITFTFKNEVCYFHVFICLNVLVLEWSLLCFSLMRRTLRCVTQDVLSSPVSLGPAEKGCAKEVISTKSPLQLQTTPGGGGGWVVGFWPCVHHCRRGKPHPSNKVKHLPVWLRWQWRRGRGIVRRGVVGGPGVRE